MGCRHNTSCDSCSIHALNSTLMKLNDIRLDLFPYQSGSVTMLRSNFDRWAIPLLPLLPISYTYIADFGIIWWLWSCALLSSYCTLFIFIQDPLYVEQGIFVFPSHLKQQGEFRHFTLGTAWEICFAFIERHVSLICQWDIEECQSWLKPGRLDLFLIVLAESSSWCWLEAHLRKSLPNWTFAALR